MLKTKLFRQSPARLSRLKTDYFTTQANSMLTQTSIPSTFRESVDEGLSMEIAISRSRISQKDGYLSNKKREKGEEELVKREKKRFFVFKNMQEFQTQLKAQRGRLDLIHPNLTAFGMTTYRGVKKSINTHQIGAHIGELASFTLIEGYDGLFAASELKKHYSNQLLVNFKKSRNGEREEPFRITETSMKKALESAKKSLRKSQEEKGDNSGASFLSLIVHKGIVFSANCGSSEALCMTKHGRMLKLARSHTTKNQEEVDRIVKRGGQLYQTTVNFPYRKEMHITGPLRVYPSGLTVTRTIGKTLSTSRRKNQSVSSSFDNPKGVLSQPEFQYIPSSEIRWVALLSSKIMQNVSQTRLRDIIEQQLAKRSSSYHQADAAEHSCRRIILQAVQMGTGDSLSVLLLIGNIQGFVEVEAKRQGSQVPVRKESTNNHEKLGHHPRSLKYIGNRHNFVELQAQQ